MGNRLLSFMLLGALGCGGGAAKYHVDDKALGDATVEERQGILAAQQAKEVARIEEQRTDSDLRNVERDLDIAENDKKTARLQRDNAKLMAKSAVTAGDLKRKDEAAHTMRVAELGVKAAEAKVDWLEKKRKWVKAQREAAEDHFAEADSRYELEKAKLVQKKGVQPTSSFNLFNFESDNLKKQQTYSSAKMEADRLRIEVEQLERNYQAQLGVYEQAKSIH